MCTGQCACKHGHHHQRTAGCWVLVGRVLDRVTAECTPAASSLSLSSAWSPWPRVSMHRWRRGVRGRRRCSSRRLSCRYSDGCTLDLQDIHTHMQGCTRVHGLHMMCACAGPAHVCMKGLACAPTGYTTLIHTYTFTPTGYTTLIHTYNFTPAGYTSSSNATSRSSTAEYVTVSPLR